MKLFKKIAGFILAFAMILAIAMPSVVMADDNYTITITPTTSDHTYEAYQIFGGRLSNDTLSDITWGDGITEAGKTALLADYNVRDAAGLAKKLSGFANNSAEVKAFAKKASNYLQNPTSAKAAGNTATINVAKAGYYLIKDKDNSLGENDETYTEFILKVVKDQTVKPKSNKPTSEKKVKDINDSTETAMTKWQDSADWDIGDLVPFQLKGTVAADYDKYTVYKMTFHDHESNGLTFDKDSVKVYVDDKQITDPTTYEVVTGHLEDNCTFEVRFADLKKEILDVKAGSVITVEYESKLNENAVIGSLGNPNEMRMEFSNNPNDEQGGETGKTPVDKVIVFTYKTIVNKVNPEGNPLEGAEFTLEKKIGEEWVEKAVIKNTEGTTFTFKGLDDGLYRLTETKTPSEYNTMNPNPLKFEITASHDKTADQPHLLTLSGDVKTGDVSFESSLENGSLTAKVVNHKGSELPSTGGMGTTILYVAGAVMILAAGAFLVMQKKAEDK